MCRNGAKNFVLLSRSGPSSNAAKEFVQTMRNKGLCVYAPECDISNLVAVSGMLAYVNENMPPIKGCIQSSMVLEVSCLGSLPSQD